MALEGAMVALHRQLAKAHPLRVLLEPHMEGTAFINWAGQEVGTDLNPASTMPLGIVVSYPCMLVLSYCQIYDSNWITVGAEEWPPPRVFRTNTGLRQSLLPVASKLSRPYALL